jgi:hypothetical protein
MYSQSGALPFGKTPHEGCKNKPDNGGHERRSYGIHGGCSARVKKTQIIANSKGAEM